MKRALFILLVLLLLVALPARAQFDYTTNADDTITITGYNGPGGDVTIPSAIDGLPVSEIGDSAFETNSSFTGVTIPGSVGNIGCGAFIECYNLLSSPLKNSVCLIERFGCGSVR